MRTFRWVHKFYLVMVLFEGLITCKEKLEEHVKATGDNIFIRFPPDPNGYLHIFHAKVVFMSFVLIKERNG